MLNRIILIGNMTKDPEMKYTTGSGVPVATFGLAVSRPTKNQAGERETDFFNIVAWRQRAEFISQYGAKGKRICVEGRVQIRNYVGQDGMKRQATEVVVDNFELLDSRDGSGSGGAQVGGGAPGHDIAPPGPGEVDDFADPFSEE